MVVLFPKHKSSLRLFPNLPLYTEFLSNNNVEWCGFAYATTQPDAKECQYYQSCWVKKMPLFYSRGSSYDNITVTSGLKKCSSKKKFSVSFVFNSEYKLLINLAVWINNIGLKI